MFRVRNTKMDVMKNMKVIEFVKKNPSLYDKKERHNNDKLSIEECWEKIASVLNETVPDAKQRWRNMKDSYFKYIKNAYDKNHARRPRRPYYLAKYLGFLKHHNQKRVEQSPLPISDSDILSESEPLDSVELPYPIIIKGESINDLEVPIEEVNLDANISDNEEVEESNLIHFSQSRQRSSDLADPVMAFEEVDKTNLAQSSQTDVKSGQPSSDVRDPDMAFLYTILPDLRTMNDKQKRKFKIGTLKLISDIYGDD